MAIIIDMPKLSDTMETGLLVEWKKKEGDPVEAGEVLAEVESDKATMELEAFDSGYLRKQIAQVGEPIPVGDPIAIVTEDADEDIGDAEAEVSRRMGGDGKAAEGDAEGSEEPQEKPRAEDVATKEQTQAGSTADAGPQQRPEPAQRETTATETDAAPSGGRVTASPVAARLAQEMGLDLSLIKGTGPGGRVVKRDIERARSEGMVATRPIGEISAAPFKQAGVPDRIGLPDADDHVDIPNTQMRKVIAGRLSESKAQIPHYYVTIEVDMGQTLELRKQLNALEGVKISVNDFVLKAAAMALEKHPLANASYQGSYIRVYNRIDIGVAVAMEDGLITPIIRNINRKGLHEISREARELAERARARRLKPNEYQGSTFTVSNLGMLGVKHFTAVINPPEAAILAVGSVREVPVINAGELEIGYRMDLTVSSDHRVLDGAQTARFLQDFKYFIENPITFAL